MGTATGIAENGRSVAAVEPEIPSAVARRIASAVQSSRSEGTRKPMPPCEGSFTRWYESNDHLTLPAHPLTVAV